MKHGKWRVDGRLAISGDPVASLTVEHSITIWALRLKFAEVLQPNKGRPTVRLMKNGELLPDAALLTDTGLTDGCSVDLLYTLGSDAVLTASNDCVARLFTLDSGECQRLCGHFGAVYTCISSPDQCHLVTASEDGSARIWAALPDGVVETQRLEHSGEVYSAVFSQCGRYVVTASQDRTVCMWRVQSGERLWTYVHAGEVYLCTFSCDDECVVSASEDCSAALISAGGICTSKLEGHSAAVNRSEFSPDGTLVVTASLDGTARIWDRKGGCKWLLKGKATEVKHATFSANSQFVFLTHVNGAEIFGAQSGALFWTLEDKEHSDLYMATSSPDSLLVAIACEDGRATLWDVQTGEHKITLEHEDAVTWISFSPCGKLLVTASWDGTAKLWSAAGECLEIFDDHAAPVIYAEFAEFASHY